LSQNDFRQHVGVGAVTRVDVEVRWPDGSVSGQKGVSVDQILELKQPR
jgi:ASPIC and UnbV